MKNIESLDKTLSNPVESVEVEVSIPSDGKPTSKAAKPAKKLAKVIKYFAGRGILIYEYNGVIHQSHNKEYDGESEYIEI